VLAIHHVDAATFLQRSVEVLKPGGQVGIVGVGRSRWPRDLVYELTAAAATRLDILVNRRKLWNHSAPMVWPPPTTWAEIEVIAKRELPGCDFTRHRQGRYTLTWTK